LALALAGCIGPSPELLGASYRQPLTWKAVLIAGDDAEPAFDNAVDALAGKLEGYGVPPANIVKLKADGVGAEAATGGNIQAAFEKMYPGPRGGCFVFITSHGQPRAGLYMKAANGYLSPLLMSRLLDASCRELPTVVIASGCFSGSFAQPPVSAKNRVILTAARPDRPSFGCNAGLRYTIFDRCVLENLIKGVAWPVVMNKARGCVAAEEEKMNVPPSEPQLSVGDSVTNLRVFSR
jgi:hypothetical protein